MIIDENDVKPEDETPEVEEPREGLEELISEGIEEGEKEGTNKEAQEATQEKGTDEVSTRLDRLETSLAEKDAEIVFLRGELSRRVDQPISKAEDGAKPLINVEELAEQITNKDPKVAAKALVELAEKIADNKIRGIREETVGLVRGSSVENAAKEADRDSVRADFERELGDQEFVQVMTRIFHNINGEAGHYVKDSLYTAAATAKTLIDKRNQRNQPHKNGVREVRVTREPMDVVTSNTSWTQRAKTINDIPDGLMSQRDKAAARAVAKRMNIPEDRWVKNFVSELKDNPNFGR